MKKALRQLIRQQLSNLSKKDLHIQSENIASVLRTLPEYQKATNIGYYLHMDEGEVETTTMITNAFEDRKRVFLPRIVNLHGDKQFSKQTKELDMLEVGSMADIAKLEPKGRYNLREPESGTDCFEAGGLDMIVLPGMGFTASCDRIGHGRGFYDSFIARHIKWNPKRPPFLVAVGAKEQLVDSIPLEPHDRKLDAVVINDKLYRKQDE